MNRLSRIIATGFFTGYSLVAPGTAGSVLALVIYWVIPGFRDYWLLSVSGIVFFIGVWAATRVEQTDGHDASIINVDEIVGMWISLLFLPGPLPAEWKIGAFILFRVFDVLKPFPINQSQNLPGGWGVMMDDVIAGIYTNLSLRLILFILIR